MGQCEAAWALSAPGRKNLIRLHDLFGRAGEAVSEFSGAVGDMDLDGIQALVLHPQAELFVNFLDGVLLEAIAHAVASVRAGHIAMLNAGYFREQSDVHPRGHGQGCAAEGWSVPPDRASGETGGDGRSPFFEGRRLGGFGRFFLLACAVGLGLFLVCFFLVRFRGSVAHNNYPWFAD